MQRQGTLRPEKSRKWHRVVMYVGHHVQDKSVGKRKGEARGILYGGVHLVTH